MTEIKPGSPQTTAWNPPPFLQAKSNACRFIGKKLAEEEEPAANLLQIYFHRQGI
jgi:hypothetical protein